MSRQSRITTARAFPTAGAMVGLALLTACVARAERPTDIVAPPSDQDVLESFQQVAIPPSVPEPTDVEIERYPTPHAMLADRVTCDGPCPLTTLLRERFTADEPAPTNWPTLTPIDEVMVFGAQTPRTCEWFLAAHTSLGWLDPISLGNSGKGCKTALDDGAIELGGKLWFPIHVEVKGRDLRIEAQTIDASDTFEIWDDPKAVATIPRRREVILCRLHVYGPGTLACANSTEDGAPLRGNAATVYSAPLLAAGSSLLPFTDTPRLGHELPARWILAPLAESTGQRLDRLPEVMSRYTPAEIVLHPLGDALPTVLVGGETPSIFLLDKGHVTHLVSHYPNYANDELRITRIERAPGLVRIDLELVSHGATRVTWRWTELVTATHHARLATGVEIHVDDTRLTGWERLVTADRSGVALRPGHGGELAWFRGTGRFTWDELGPAAQRWHLAFAHAWDGVRQEMQRRHDTAQTGRSHGKEAVGYLVTIPGFAEPANRVIYDAVTPLTRSK